MTHRVKGIVVHCSDSSWGSPAIIRQWHLGRGMSDIGYHLVIGNGRQKNSHTYWPESDGVVWPGRPLDEKGAHAYGRNDWVGICLVGRTVFTTRQMDALYGACARICLENDLGPQDVIGHYETPYEGGRGSERKTCPNVPGHELRHGVERAIQTLRGADSVSAMLREALH